jgi:hypothetical protein
MTQNFTKGVGLSLALLLGGHAGFAQLVGSKTIPGSYASVSAAIADLNTQGVGLGGVTFNIAPGYTETLTASPLSITTVTGSAANPIVFQKGTGGGANPVITAYTGGTGTNATAVPDGIWNLTGADYVTINGIDLQENAANTTAASMMEYGYGLFKASATNGCQHVTIKNCTITLNRANVTNGASPMPDGAIGILSVNSLPGAATTALAVTAASGSNSFNQFYSNTIQNANIGIALNGYADVAPFTNADNSNDIGGSSLSTGNTILNFGGGTTGATTGDTLVSGILAMGQYNWNASYNTINSNNGSGVTHNNEIHGIYNKSGDGANVTINNNTISLFRKIGVASFTGLRLTAIENNAGSNGTGNTVTINNNTITNIKDTAAVTSSSNHLQYGIYNAASPAILNISQNTFSNDTNCLSSGNFYYIYNIGLVGNQITIDGNNFLNTNFNTTTLASANAQVVRYIYNNGASSNCATTVNNVLFVSNPTSVALTAAQAIISGVDSYKITPSLTM